MINIHPFDFFLYLNMMMEEKQFMQLSLKTPTPNNINSFITPTPNNYKHCKDV